VEVAEVAQVSVPTGKQEDQAAVHIMEQQVLEHLVKVILVEAVQAAEVAVLVELAEQVVVGQEVLGLHLQLLEQQLLVQAAEAE
jgi:hypothetical protein